MQTQLGRLIDAKVKGPGATARAAGKTEFWGLVRDAEGNTLEGTLTAPEGYNLTAECADHKCRANRDGCSGLQNSVTGLWGRLHHRV